MKKIFYSLFLVTAVIAFFAIQSCSDESLSGDGIYTSSQTFNHDDRIQYNERELTKSVLESPIVDSEFAQSALLHKKMDNYDLRKGQIQSRWIEVTCDVEFGTSGCLADEWGWCNSCCVTVDLSSCSLTVGI